MPIFSAERTMAEEVELKLALAVDQQARFLRHPLLKQAVDRRLDTLDSIYYDTEDLALRRRGIALRVRRRGRDWLQTVKLAGISTAGLSSRSEWETPYEGHFDFSCIEQAAVREWLQRPKRLARIVPICETRFRRVTWRFSAAPGAVLLTLDRGWIVAAGRREAISEVELELAGAPVQAIFGLASEIARRVTLTPSALSKAERGYRLHTAAPQTPVKAETIALTADMPPFEAFRRIALSSLEQLQQNHAGAMEGANQQYIHQIRVAMRRLRAALRMFAPILPEQFADSLRGPLSALMERLDSAQRLDAVLGEIVDPVLNALPDEPRLPVLAGKIAVGQRSANARTIAWLAAPEYGRALLTVLERLHQLAPANRTMIPLLRFATQRLNHLVRELKKLAAAAKIADPESLHAFGVGVRRLHRALEMCSSLAAPGRLRRVLKRLAAIEDPLIRLDELTEAGALLVECSADDPRLREAVTLIGGWHGSRYARLLASISSRRLALTKLRLPELA